MEVKSLESRSIPHLILSGNLVILKVLEELLFVGRDRGVHIAYWSDGGDLVLVIKEIVVVPGELAPVWVR